MAKYVTRVGDTFDKVANLWYGDSRLGGWLQRVNQGRKAQPGDVLDIPGRNVPRAGPPPLIPRETLPTEVSSVVQQARSERSRVDAHVAAGFIPKRGDRLFVGEDGGISASPQGKPIYWDGKTQAATLTPTAIPFVYGMIAEEEEIPGTEFLSPTAGGKLADQSTREAEKRRVEPWRYGVPTTEQIERMPHLEPRQTAVARRGGGVPPAPPTPEQDRYDAFMRMRSEVNRNRVYQIEGPEGRLQPLAVQPGSTTSVVLDAIQLVTSEYPKGFFGASDDDPRVRYGSMLFERMREGLAIAPSAFWRAITGPATYAYGSVLETLKGGLDKENDPRWWAVDSETGMRLKREQLDVYKRLGRPYEFRPSWIAEYQRMSQVQHEALEIQEMLRQAQEQYPSRIPGVAKLLPAIPAIAAMVDVAEAMLRRSREKPAHLERSASLRNEAWGLARENDFDGAKAKLAESYREYGAAAVWYDATFAYTWWRRPEKEDAFFEQLASAELQKGEPLTESEIRAIKNVLVEPWLELQYEALFDFTNLIPIGWATAPIQKAFKSGLMTVVRSFWKGVDNIVLKEFSELPWLARKTIRPMAEVFHAARQPALESTASKLRSQTINAFGAAAEGVSLAVNEAGQSDFVSAVETIGRVVTSSATPDDVIAVSRSVTPRQWRIFRSLVDLYDPNSTLAAIKTIAPSNWGVLVSEARDRVYGAVLEEAQRGFLRRGKTIQEASVLARREALKAASNPKALLYEFAENFRSAFLAPHHVLGYDILDDNLLYRVAKKLGAFDKGILGLSPSSATKIVRGWLTTSSWLMGKWAYAVLALRPAWVMINLVDSAFRYMIAGGHFFDDLGPVWKTLYEKIGREMFVPAETMQAFARREVVGSVAERMAFEGYRPQLLGLMRENWERLTLEAAEKGLGDGTSAVRKVYDVLGRGLLSFGDSFKDFNSAIEFTLRVRLMYQEYSKAFLQLDRHAWGVLRAQLALREGIQPQTLETLEGIWLMAGSNPEKFMELVRQLRNMGSEGRRVWSLLIPANLTQFVNKLSAQERDLVMGPIVNRINDLIQGHFVRNEPLTADALRSAFGDILEALDARFNDLMTAPLTHAPKEAITDLTAKPGADIAEPSLAAAAAQAPPPPKPEVPISEVSPKPEVKGFTTGMRLKKGAETELGLRELSEFTGLSVDELRALAPEYEQLQSPYSMAPSTWQVQGGRLAQSQATASEASRRFLRVGKVGSTEQKLNTLKANLIQSSVDTVTRARSGINRWLFEIVPGPARFSGSQRVAKWQEAFALSEQVMSSLDTYLKEVSQNVSKGKTIKELDAIVMPSASDILTSSGMELLFDGSRFRGMLLKRPDGSKLRMSATSYPVLQLSRYVFGGDVATDVVKRVFVDEPLTPDLIHRISQGLPPLHRPAAKKMKTAVPPAPQMPLKPRPMPSVEGVRVGLDVPEGYTKNFMETAIGPLEGRDDLLTEKLLREAQEIKEHAAASEFLEEDGTLPLWHATTNLGSVNRTGLRSGMELKTEQIPHAGLGGSPSYVSLTYSWRRADMAGERLRVAARAARGEATVEEILSAADRWAADAFIGDEGWVDRVYFEVFETAPGDDLDISARWDAVVKHLNRTVRTPEERFKLVTLLDRALSFGDFGEGGFNPSALLLDTWEKIKEIDPDQVGVIQVGIAANPKWIEHIPGEQEIRVENSSDVFALLDPALTAQVGPEAVRRTVEYDAAYQLVMTNSLPAVRETNPVLGELLGDYVKWSGHPDFPIDEWWRTHFPQMSETKIKELRSKAANHILSGTEPGKGAKNIKTAIERLRETSQRVVFQGSPDTPPPAYILELLDFKADDIDGIEAGWKFLGKERLAQEAERRRLGQDAWQAWIQQPGLSGKSRAELWGPSATQDQWTFSLHVQDLIDDGIENGWETKSPEALQALRELKRQVDDWRYTEQLVNITAGHPASQVLEEGLPMAQKPVWELPEGVKVWLGATENMTGRYAVVRDAVAQMRDRVLADLESGGPSPVGGLWRIGEDQLDIIDEWSNRAVMAKQRALDISLYGSGEQKLEALGGVTYEGAVSITNRWMLDYESYSNADNFMRGFFPFWKFPSRSLPMWFSAISMHPEILSWYQKYMRFSQRQLWQAGAVTTDGRILPSLEGHVRVPGTNLWVDLSAPLSVKYAFRLLDAVDILRGQGPYWSQEDQEASPMEQIVSFLVSAGRHFGFSISPWLSGVFTLTGLTDPQRDPPMDLVPQIDLFPKWVFEDLTEKLRRVYWPNADPIRWDPRVGWEDYLVETDILTWASQRLDEASTDREKNEIIQQVQRAFLSRERDDLWIQIRHQTRKSDYWRNFSGYFIGLYAKEWSDADAELRSLRNRRNQLIAAINSRYGADLLGMDMEAAEAYEFYLKNRYQTPEGQLSTLYDLVRYTVTPEGQQLYGDDRRVEVARRVHEDESTKAYYDSVEMLSQWLESNLSTIPVGTPGDDPQITTIWDEYWKKRDLLEKNQAYAAARRTWTIGYKPETLIYTTFRNLWWRMLGETRPRWKKEEGEEYDTFQKRVAEWEESLPLLAQSRAREFLDLTVVPRVKTEGMEALPAEMVFEVPGGRELSARLLLQNLLAETNKKGLDAWYTETDTIYDALNWAYMELYVQPYMDSVTRSGYQGDLAEYDFLQEHPRPPAPIELAAKVTTRYGTRFDEEDLISRASGETGPLSIEERRDRQMAGDPTTLPYQRRVQRVWDLLGWAGPGSQTALLAQYKKLGGDEGLLDVWWEVGERWVRPEDQEAMASFTKMADTLDRAAQLVNLQPPGRTKLVEWVQAQADNKVFQAQVQRLYGDTIYDLLAIYRATEDKAEKRQLRSIYPEIDLYYDAKDAYAKEHPVWAKYYNPDALEPLTTSTTSAGGSGGRGGTGRKRSARGGSARTAPLPQTGLYTLALGRRSTVDPNDLLRNLGGGGVGGSPRWPPGFLDAAGPLVDEIIALASKGTPLSDAGAAFLGSLASRHPEWAGFTSAVQTADAKSKGYMPPSQEELAAAGEFPARSKTRRNENTGP